MTTDDERLEWRIRTFFIYWQKRHDFIISLETSKHHHEANVLIWAALDALSNLWKQNIGKSVCSYQGKRLVFNAFLSRYGGELFQSVSLPDVWNRVDSDEAKSTQLPESTCEFLRGIGNRRPPTFVNERQLRQSTDDWDINRVTASTLRVSPETDRRMLEEWLVRSQYGAIAYKVMRSPYIHEGQPGKRSHGFTLSRSSISPTYLSGIYTTPPTMGFSISFMSCILKRCIDGFEADALELGEDPAPSP